MGSKNYADTILETKKKAIGRIRSKLLMLINKSIHALLCVSVYALGGQILKMTIIRTKLNAQCLNEQKPVLWKAGRKIRRCRARVQADRI